MSRRNRRNQNFQNVEAKTITDGIVVDTSTKECDTETENKPTLEKGNYIIEVLEQGQVIKKIAVANAEINIQRLADGGMTVDLK